MGERDESTCFVRNLSASVTDEQVTQLFGEVGPVRKAFLVRDKGAEGHKGMAFVSYALKEDAEKATRQLGGCKLDGKTIHVEIAKKRKSLDERNAKRRSAGATEFVNKKTTRGKKSDPADRLAVEPEAEPEESDEAMPDEATAAATSLPRTRSGGGGVGLSADAKAALCQAVAIGNIPEAYIASVLNLAGSCGDVVKIEDPVPEDVAAFAKLQQDGCGGRTVLVHFGSGKQAFEAVPALHRAAPGGSGQEQLWCRQVNGEGARVKRWRIIVRNLPFGTAEAELQKLLKPVGFVWQAHIPKANGKMKGFGFLSFTCRTHAERAIVALNGKEFKGRVLAADWSIAKHAFATQADGAPPAPHDGETYGHDASDTLQTSGPEVSEEAGDEAAGADAGDAGAIVSDDLRGEAEASGDEGPAEEAPSGGSSQVAHKLGESGLSGKQLLESAHADPATSEAEHEVLQRVLKRIVSHDEAGPSSKGAKTAESVAEGGKGARTRGERKAKGDAAAAAEGGAAAAEGGAGPEWQGREAEAPAAKQDGDGVIRRQVFVRNVPLDASPIDLQGRLERFGVVKACRLVMNKSTGKPKGTAFVEFGTAEAAGKAVAACQAHRDGKGAGVSLKGKQLSIDAALVQDSARALAQQQDGFTHDKDKRNLYLAKEGVIDEKSALWAQLSAADQRKRQAAAKEVAQKLKSPNFFVSPTRLHVMNVPAAWEQKELKACCRAAVLERSTQAQPRIKQCTILRDMERLDDSGQPKSRGIGFVEFDAHEHALACLRQLNNNPGVLSGQKRLIVEFAIENVKILKTRERKVRQQQEEARNRTQVEGAEDAVQAVAEQAAGQDKKRKRGKDGKAAGKGGSAQTKPQEAQRRLSRELDDRRTVRNKALDGKKDSKDRARRGPTGGNEPSTHAEKGGTTGATTRASRSTDAQSRSQSAGQSDARGGVAPSQKGQRGSAAAGVRQKRGRVLEDLTTDALAAEAKGAAGASSKQSRRNKRKKEGDTDDLDRELSSRARKLFGLDGSGAGQGKRTAKPSLDPQWLQ